MKAKDAASYVLDWAKQFGTGVSVIAAKNIDSVISQVVYTVEGVKDIIIGEFDKESGRFNEISISQDLIKKLTEKNIWKE